MYIINKYVLLSKENKENSYMSLDVENIRYRSNCKNPVGEKGGGGTIF